MELQAQGMRRESVLTTADTFNVILRPSSSFQIDEKLERARDLRCSLTPAVLASNVLTEPRHGVRLVVPAV
jgi:hypothetical protein